VIDNGTHVIQQRGSITSPVQVVERSWIWTALLFNETLYEFESRGKEQWAMTPVANPFFVEVNINLYGYRNSLAISTILVSFHDNSLLSIGHVSLQPGDHTSGLPVSAINCMIWQG
jgi:hypothetical protein